ncbi:hypothetical protein [Streptomyces phytohabitans]|uniref:hypothetical protein n=1 Tax=Streptomyces phytohabitans TaxID=1150371 RepID=UPI00345BDA96
MSDNRYEWLDKETAERLLRGLPVDSTRLNGSADSAERLATALGALSAEPADGLLRRTAAEVPGELPGEAAAMDAFRSAQEGVLRSRPVATVPDAVPEAAVSGARVGAAAGAGAWSGSGARSGSPSVPAFPAVGSRTGVGGGRRPWTVTLPGLAGLAGRPLRAGFAMAVAGCALGGVAVAAGAGVLPTPFGGVGGGPAKPGVSASTTESAENEEREGVGDDADGRKGGREGRPGSSEGERGGPTGGKSSAPGKGVIGEGWNGERLPDDAATAAIVQAVCKAYADGTIAGDDRRKLEKAAGGPAAVEAYCAKFGGTPGASTPGGGTPGGGLPGGTPGGGEGGEGGESGDGSTGDPGGDGGTGEPGGPGGEGGDSGDPGGEGGDSGESGDGTTGGETGGESGDGSSGGDAGGTESGGAESGGTGSGGETGGTTSADTSGGSADDSTGGDGSGPSGTSDPGSGGGAATRDGTAS